MQQSAMLPQSRSPRQLALALTVALGLVFGAWMVGGRSDFSLIGTGGTNGKPIPRAGELAREFQALRITESLEVELVSFSEYAGRPIWLNFWGSWCQPCRLEMPDMINAYGQLKGTGLVLLAVSLDEPIEEAFLYAAEVGANFTVLSDPNRQYTGRNYQINNFPTHIFIDASGIVRAVELAPMSVETALANAKLALSPPST